MSKKKKKKFKARFGPQAQVANSGVVNTGMPVHTSAPAAMVSPTTPPPAAATAVKSAPQPADSSANAVYASHRGEYQTIQADLIKVLIINGLLFAVIIAMYFINQSNPFLDSLYSRIF